MVAKRKLRLQWQEVYLPTIPSKFSPLHDADLHERFDFILIQQRDRNWSRRRRKKKWSWVILGSASGRVAGCCQGRRRASVAQMGTLGEKDMCTRGLSILDVSELGLCPYPCSVCSLSAFCGHGALLTAWEVAKEREKVCISGPPGTFLVMNISEFTSKNS